MHVNFAKFSKEFREHCGIVFRTAQDEQGRVNNARGMVEGTAFVSFKADV